MFFGLSELVALYTFFYKKPVDKKPRATEVKKLRNLRATLLDSKKL